MLKEILNEVKLGSGEKALSYLKLIKRAVKSKIMNIRKEDGYLIVDYDEFSLVFKDDYLIGLIIDKKIYQVNPKVKSIKDINNLWIMDRLKSKEVDSIKDLKVTNGVKPKYKVKDRKELKEIIKNAGKKENLNYLDVSSITDMSGLFRDYGYDFDGDISEWDVSNVKNMASMFEESSFNRDISKWDVSNVEDMSGMFAYSIFNGDISKWDVSNVKNMSNMFYSSKFIGDISNWNVKKVRNMSYMFAESKIKRCKDLEKWNIDDEYCNIDGMFEYSECEGVPSWY